MTTTPLTIRQALEEWTTRLPRAEAEYLLLHALGHEIHERAWLRANASEPIAQITYNLYQGICQKRLDKTPLAYLTGRKAFHGLSLMVDERVLDPRDDTETLVDWAIESLLNSTPTFAADLGTGSGAIALALADKCKRTQVWAVDVCEDALSVARDNARILGLSVQFARGDWISPLLKTGIQFDLLVSNPPYIPEGDPHLSNLRQEPLKALVSGADGLDDIRRIVSDGPLVLRPAGWLLLEHGYDQAGAVAELMIQRGFIHVQHRKDLGGILRCTGGQWPGPTERG